MFYRNFMRFVTRNFREEHFVSFYADKLAISEQYLARIVRAGTGKSVNTIINELLIMEARTLLSSTKSTVGDIASGLALVMLPVSVSFSRGIWADSSQLSEGIMDLSENECRLM